MGKGNLAYPPGKITLREVGLRDGLQMVRAFPSTAGKKAWIDAEHAAGIRHFEVGSFCQKTGIRLLLILKKSSHMWPVCRAPTLLSSHQI